MAHKAPAIDGLGKVLTLFLMRKEQIPGSPAEHMNIKESKRARPAKSQCCGGEPSRMQWNQENLMLFSTSAQSSKTINYLSPSCRDMIWRLRSAELLAGLQLSSLLFFFFPKDVASNIGGTCEKQKHLNKYSSYFSYFSTTVLFCKS